MSYPRQAAVVVILVMACGLFAGEARAQRPESFPGLVGAGDLVFVEGTLLGEDGARLAGARVTLRRLAEPNGRATVTRSGGRFAFRDLARGRYVISVAALGYAATELALDLSGGSQGVRITLERTGRLSSHRAAADSRDYREGVEALERGDYETSLMLLRAAADAHPDYAPAYANLGAVYIQLRAMDRARQSFEDALDLDPGSAAAHLGMGLVLNNEQRYQSAERHLLEARTALPSDWRVHYELGRSYYGLGRLSAAEQSLREARTVEPRYGNLYILLGNALVLQNKYAEGLRALETFLDVAPDSPLAPKVREKTELLAARLSAR